MEKQITIAGQSFVIPLRYIVGHQITEGEAAALNQTLAENIRNNMAKKVKDGAGQAEVTEYATGYEFTVGGVASERKVVDPIEREARKIAKAALAAKVQEVHGLSLSKFYVGDEGKAALEAKIDEIAAKETILALAKKNVAAQKKQLDALTSETEL